MADDAEAIVSGIRDLCERFPVPTVVVTGRHNARAEDGTSVDLMVSRNAVDDAFDKWATRRDLRRAIAEAGLPPPDQITTLPTVYNVDWHLPLAMLPALEPLTNIKLPTWEVDELVSALRTLWQWFPGMSIGLSADGDKVDVEVSFLQRVVREQLGADADRGHLRGAIQDAGGWRIAGRIETRYRKQTAYIARFDEPIERRARLELLRAELQGDDP